MNEKYIVRAPNGDVITSLNPRFARAQKATDEQLEALKLSHQLRWIIFGAAKEVVDEPLKLKLLANMFAALESEQQKLWNFKPNQDYHRFFDFPGCHCPKMDNEDRLGTSQRVYAVDCQIHGKK